MFSFAGIPNAVTGGISEIHEVSLYFVGIRIKGAVKKQSRKLVARPQDFIYPTPRRPFEFRVSATLDSPWLSSVFRVGQPFSLSQPSSA